jgi:hypothetical protein
MFKPKYKKLIKIINNEKQTIDIIIKLFFLKNFSNIKPKKLT